MHPTAHPGHHHAPAPTGRPGVVGTAPGVERASGTGAAVGIATGPSGALSAPPGVGRGSICYGLVQNEKAKIHSNDFFMVRYTPREAIADILERKFYVRTRAARSYDYLAPLFDRSKLENVVTRKEDCLNQECENLDKCNLDRGDTHCYWASKYSRAMLDPYWIGGVAKYTKRTTLGRVVILRKDNVSPLMEKLEPDVALKTLEEGRFMASGGALDAPRSEPFYNPYIVNPTEERLALHRRYFEHLLKLVPCYLVNTGAAKTTKIITQLTKLK